MLVMAIGPNEFSRSSCRIGVECGELDNLVATAQKAMKTIGYGAPE